MKWHVQYRRDTLDHVGRFPTSEQAIEAACCLIDDGCDVCAISTGSLTDFISRDQIVRIYAMWVRAKYPLDETTQRSSQSEKLKVNLATVQSRGS